MFLRHHAAMLAMAALLAMASGPTAAQEPTASSQSWTTEKIVEVPRVDQTLITSDGRHGLVLVRQDHVASNSRDSRLLLVDFATKDITTLLSAPWISALKFIPGTQDLSVLADLGEGAQLYRLHLDGTVKPIVVRPNTVLIGADTSQAILVSAYETDQRFGVLDYDWSPDGRFLWYTTASYGSTREPDVQIIERPTWSPLQLRPNTSELRLFDLHGNDTQVASAPGGQTTQSTVAFSYGAGRWERGAGNSTLMLHYSTTEIGHEGQFEPVPWVFDPVAGISTRANEGEQVTAQTSPNTILRTETRGYQRRLFRVLPGQEPEDLGSVGFEVGGAWARGQWNVPDGGIVAAVRDQESNLRSNLLKVSADGKVSELEPDVSLTHCVMAEVASRGLCIREGLNVPPQVVAIDTENWRQELLAPLDGRYQDIAPLQVRPTVWRSGKHRTQGFVIYPRDYEAGKQYPAILITHGRDGDNTFAQWSFQWNYPVQVWAERGYFVIVVNDLPLDGDPERQNAYTQWATGKGHLTPEQLNRVIWLDQVDMLRAVIKSLDSEGLIDPTRLGIAGYSRGSQIVNAAITQTKLFRAASTGDGDYLNPSGYWLAGHEQSYVNLFGGSPYDSRYRQFWRQYSPAYRADRVTAAVLFQVSDYYYYSGKLEFYRALRERFVPAEFVLFTRETHLLHWPFNRMVAMEQNVDWFDFWLKGTENVDSGKSAQYQRWRLMPGATQPK